MTADYGMQNARRSVHSAYCSTLLILDFRIGEVLRSTSCLLTSIKSIHQAMFTLSQVDLSLIQVCEIIIHNRLSKSRQVLVRKK